jgi:hypothetical protein
MWGLNWGQMIWGQAAAVPALSFWAVILLAAVLGAWGVRRLRSPRPRMAGMIALAAALLLPISARALPFTFTNGTVADANQVNANFAAVVAGQGLAPSATANLIDITSTGACPEVVPPSGVTLGNVVGSNGIGSAFSIPTGQTLVLTSLSVAFQAGPAGANHGVSVRFWRFTSSGGNPVEGTVITLDAQGAGSATIPLGTGSPFGAGTNLCVLAQDLVTLNSINANFAAAHGFLTTQ